ncbi:unnamed protein product [Echinostoma caproni]|uniref:Uncharacterized protein n=1 Tax=Echinostoma caproni TaxID=27848 RepID=A0A183A428_9TREM|nr:unnamed protein product [Echinostoma caproni]
MPFQGTDPCLPLASTLTSTLTGFRPSEQQQQLDASVPSASLNTNAGLPQLWASSNNPVCTFSPIPICPTSLSHSTTFPINVNAGSASLTPVVPAVTTSTTITNAINSSQASSTSTGLPQPPALQPCPALTKRFQRLCPLPASRSPVSSVSASVTLSPTKRAPGLTMRAPALSATYGNEKRTGSTSVSEIGQEDYKRDLKDLHCNWFDQNNLFSPGVNNI